MAILEKILCPVCGVLITVNQEGLYVCDYCGTYTNLTPITEPIGGILPGTTFNEATLKDVLDMLFYPEYFPTLTNPSHSFSLTPNGLFEIGSVINMVFTTEFNRGSIIPAYTTNGYRSGAIISFFYIGNGIAGENPANNEYINVKNLTYTVLAGEQIWQSYVHFLIGDQPVGSKGTAYESPYPEGDTEPILVKITGVYPYFANNINITIETKQPLVLMNTPYVDITFIAEDDINKQYVEFPNDWWTITGIEMFNDDDWIWIGGSKENSLLTFNIVNTTNEIQSEVIGYKRYYHNGSKVGSRTLRFHTR